MQLSIIIVSYNVRYFLEQCLCSVEKAITGVDAEVLVVDNCSADGSLEYLLPKFPWVKFIAEKTNRGFAKANNIALQHCTGDYILYLNPDTIIPETILQHCLDFFENNKDVGAVGVRMLDGSANFLPESKRSFPSPLVSFYKLSGLSSLFPRSGVFNKYALGDLSENGTHEVDVLCGAFMMAERKILQAINGFDEAFFMYGEDIDLCYRIQKSGKKIYYLGIGAMIHFKGESSLSDNKKYVKIFYRAMFVFVNKHYSSVNAAFMKLFLQAGIISRSLLSFIALPFKKISKYRDKTGTRKKSFLLFGDEASVTNAEYILTANNIQALRTSAELNAKNKPVVLCIGEKFSYQDGIRLMQQHKNGPIYYWHGHNSQSIVSSADKNFTGAAYALGTAVEAT